MAQYSTTLFLADVRRGAMLPAASSATFSDADLLRIADQETQAGIVPLIMGVREDYFATHVDVTITTGAASQTIRIPTRSIGGALNEVQFTQNGLLINVSQIERSELHECGPGFYVEGNNLVLYNSGGTWSYPTLRLSYYQRPNRLVLPAAVGTITNIVGLVVTVGAMPATIASATPVDLVKATPGHECLAIDRTDGVVAGNNITLASVPTGLAIGDYVCLAEETPVPQLPTELQPVLVQRTIVKALEAIGDRAGSGAAQAKLTEIEAVALKLLSPRVDGEPKVIRNRSPLWG